MGCLQTGSAYQVLFLFGKDNADTQVHDLVGARSTNRAVIKLLEDHLGIRWFLPIPHGEWIPTTQQFKVLRNLDVHFQPAFVYSDGRSYDRNVLNEPGRSLSAQANNFRKAVKASPGGHTYYVAVSADQYFEEHPEYFALIEGKRTRQGNHLNELLQIAES